MSPFKCWPMIVTQMTRGPPQYRCGLRLLTFKKSYNSRRFLPSREKHLSQKFAGIYNAFGEAGTTMNIDQEGENGCKLYCTLASSVFTANPCQPFTHKIGMLFGLCRTETSSQKIMVDQIGSSWFCWLNMESTYIHVSTLFIPYCND